MRFLKYFRMDVDVEEAALEQVAALLQRPDQLEKLPELKKRADRKKVKLINSSKFIEV